MKECIDLVSSSYREFMSVCLCVFRRENVLRIPQGWIYYLAPEIVRRMGPEVDEDQLPFSKAADVYAFGYISLFPTC